jgi:hypothetical protein
LPATDIATRFLDEEREAMTAPAITSLLPSTGSIAGGNTVVITGTAITAATTVAFGATVLTSGYVVKSATEIDVASAPAHAAGAVDVTVTTSGGTSGALVYTYQDFPTLFTVAEARAFDKLQLANATSYPDADIILTEARIRAQFERNVSVSFVPVSVTKRMSGDGSNEIILPHQEVSAVTACVIYNPDGSVNETLDADDLADLAIEPYGLVARCSRGVFIRGRRNVEITYTHGYANVPADIKRVALIVCCLEMIPTDISDRTTSFSDGNMTFQMSRAGGPGHWYGYDTVDAVLRGYDRTLPGIA